MDENIGTKNYSGEKYRYFFFSFSIAFLTLSLMFLFLMSAVHPKTPESLLREPETDVSPTAYVPTEEDTLSVLFIGVADESAVAGTFILARFDPVRGKVPIVVLPPQTGLQNGDKIEPISEIYRYGGADYTRDALAETLGFPVDRYVRMRVDSFILGASAIGSVEYELAEPVTINRGGAPVILNKGKQLLDGQKVSDIIRYQDYPGGELERCKIAGELTAAIVNQRMDICRSTVFDNVFEKLINLINSDISYTDFHNRKYAAEFLAQIGDNPAVPIEVSGHFSEDDKLYTLSDTFIALLNQSMR